MALNANEIEVIISANSTDAEQSINRVTKGLNGLSNTTASTSSAMMSSLTKLATKYLSIAATVKFVASSISASMERIEDENLFSVSLGESADEVRAWSNQVQQSLGISAAWLRKNTGVLMTMTKSMGVSSDNALVMSKNFSLLAQDMASFYNISADEAFSKLQSGLAGQSRPLQELGIMIRDVDLEATALSMGIEKQGNAFTSAQKAILVYQTVLNATSNAQGDLSRTLNTPANQLRILITNFNELKVAIGNLFIPIVSVVLPVLNKITVAATNAFNAMAKLFGFNATYDEATTDVENLASGYDDASDSAKALKRQLAGFDEMNVLQDNSASASGSTGANAGLENAQYDTSWIDKLNSFEVPAGLTKFLEIIGAIVAGLATFKFLTSDVGMTILTALGSPIQTLQGLFFRLGDAIKVVWGVISAHPIAAIVAVIVALLLTSEDFRALLKDLAGNVLAQLKRIIESLQPLFTKITEFLGQLWEKLQVLISALMPALQQCADMFMNLLVPVIDLLIVGIDVIFQILSPILDLIIQILDVTIPIITEIVTTLVNALMPILNAIIEVLKFIINIVKTIIEVVTSVITAIINTITGFINWAKEGFSGLINFIKQLWDGLKNFLGGICNSIGNFFGSVWTNMKNGAKGAWDGIKNIFGNLADFFGNIFSNAWNKVKQVFSVGGKIFEGIKDGIFGAFKAVVNGIITGINNVVAVPFNAINWAIDKVRGIEIAGWKPFDWVSRISVPQIPYLAKGGIVDGRTLAMIGENGREAVLPLEKNTGWMDTLANKLGGNQPTQIVVKIGEETIIDKVIDGVNNLTGLNNRTMLNI